MACIVAAVTMLAVPDRACAHGVLKASSPAHGSHLSTAPRELRLLFTERVELAVARLQLLGPDGRVVSLGPAGHGDSPMELVAAVTGPVTAGPYAVAWSIVGRDGHPVRGRLQFTIAPGAAGLAGDPGGVAAHAAGTSDGGHHDPVAMPGDGAGFGAQSPAYALIRWFSFACALALVGTVGFALGVVPRARRRTGGDEIVGDARMRRFGMFIAAGLIVGAAMRLAAQSIAMHGLARSLDPDLVGSILTRTLWGQAWLLAVGASLVALAGFRSIGGGPGRGWTLIIPAAVGTAVSMALSGHAAAVPARTAMVVLADTVHVLGAGGWIGTLSVLSIVGLGSTLRASAGTRGRHTAALVAAFAPVALACAGTAAVSGLILAWTHVGSLSGLTTSRYGWTLLAKLAILGLVAGVGAWNWRRVGPRLGADDAAHTVRTSATAELVFAGMVLLATAVLVATPPGGPG